MYYLAVLLGCLIYVGLQLNQAFALKDFSWKLFLKTNAIPTVLNLIIGCSMVFIKAELVNVYPITLLSALILGISGQAILKKFTNMFDSKVNTVIGL